MEPPPRRRLQFSLGTLVFGVIAAGAVIGMIFAYYENRKLNAEIHALKEQFGFLTIDDPTKIWARSVVTDESYKWRFRIYVPREGDYQIGVQTQNVVAAGIDPIMANYHALKVLRRGEFILEAKVVRQSDDRGILELRVPQSNVCEVQLNSYVALNWKEPGFDTWSHENIGEKICPLTDASRSFDEDKPVMLLAIKTKKFKTIEGKGKKPESVPVSTSDPGPGLLIWLEKREPGQF